MRRRAVAGSPSSSWTPRKAGRPARLKAALIGIGKRAVEDHVPGIAQAQRAELVAVCDRDPAALRAVESMVDVPRFTDYRTLLERVDVDFIVVATPHDQYLEIIEAAAARGVHVLKEKPFARSLAEARRIQRIAERSGIQVMTALQRRFNPIYTTFFQLIDGIGRPFYLDIRYTIFTNSPHAGWRGRRERAGGGCIIDMGYHMIDLLMWYFGVPNRVFTQLSADAVDSCAYDAEDTATILFAYPGGLHGVCIFSRVFPPKTESFKVIGTNGLVEVERGSIRRCATDGEVLEHIVREKARPSASAAQIDYFSRTIAGERENPGSPEHHLKHAAFVEACYASARSGAAVDPTELMGDPHGRARDLRW